ncbi:uncharacterized protein PG986_011333 [Apiospora aurea]|uniref:Uncharacterized protein n=1 Tax=Apiospora aurea TaxID=335848 RepID=A0ABR1Q4U3_9PEZI
MKTFFVALLALPAALAAPAPQADKHEATACACANATATLLPGRARRGAHGECLRRPLCAQEYPDYPQQACVKTNACPLIGDYQQPCERGCSS